MLEQCKDVAGARHQLGDSYIGTDGCNRCKCLESGSACTKRLCPAASEAEAERRRSRAEAGKCVDNLGVLHEVGQVSCDWRRAGHVTRIMTSDWSAIHPRGRLQLLHLHRGRRRVHAEVLSAAASQLRGPARRGAEQGGGRGLAGHRRLQHLPLWSPGRRVH